MGKKVILTLLNWILKRKKLLFLTLSTIFSIKYKSGRAQRPKYFIEVFELYKILKFSHIRSYQTRELLDFKILCFSWECNSFIVPDVYG